MVEGLFYVPAHILGFDLLTPAPGAASSDAPSAGAEGSAGPLRGQAVSEATPKPQAAPSQRVERTVQAKLEAIVRQFLPRVSAEGGSEEELTSAEGGSEEELTPALAFLRSIGVDPSLLQSAAGVLKRPPGLRGPFDRFVVQQFEETVQAHATFIKQTSGARIAALRPQPLDVTTNMEAYAEQMEREAEEERRFEEAQRAAEEAEEAGSISESVQRFIDSLDEEPPQKPGDQDLAVRQGGKPGKEAKLAGQAEQLGEEQKDEKEEGAVKVVEESGLALLFVSPSGAWRPMRRLRFKTQAALAGLVPATSPCRALAVIKDGSDAARTRRAPRVEKIIFKGGGHPAMRAMRAFREYYGKTPSCRACEVGTSGRTHTRPCQERRRAFQARCDQQNLAAPQALERGGRRKQVSKEPTSSSSSESSDGDSNVDGIVSFGG